MHGFDLIAAASRFGLAVIFNSLWQGALIAGVAWLTLRIFNRTNATTRYAVWSLSLFAILVVPVITSCVGQTPAVNSPVASASVGPGHSRTPARAHLHSQEIRSMSATSQEHQGSSAVSSSVAWPTELTLPAVPWFVTAAVFGLWVLGALAILARLIVGLMQLERLKRDSLPLDVAYRDAMPQWTAALKGERDVRICVSEEIEVPVAVGLFDSMVLLPSQLVHSLEPSEIDQISLHELGHLLRADDWTNALQRIIAGLLFFNPAAWLVSRQMDVEREVACDDYVLQLTGAVRPYAFCLTKMAEMTAWPHHPVPAPGVFVTRKNISIRIERLLRTGRAIGSSIAPTTAGVVTAALIAMFFLLRMVTPSIAFTEPQVAAPAEPASTPIVQSEPKAVPKAVPHVAVAPVPSAAPRIVYVHDKTVAPAVAASTAVNEVSKVMAAVTSSVMSNAESIERRDAGHKGGNIGMAVASNGSCTGCDFSRADLSGRDFTNRSLTGSDFKDATLRNARFDHADLTGTDFENADLRGASFTDANMQGCDLRGARLDGANFTGANITGCDINVASLSPEQAREFLTKCTGCDFKNVNLRGMNLRGIHVQGADMQGADLRDTDLAGASFTGVDFTGAKLSGARVDNTSFEGCDFSHADLRGVDMSKANLTGASMGSAIWQ